MKEVTLSWCIQDTLKFQDKLHPPVGMFLVQDQSDLEDTPLKVRIDNDINMKNDIEINLETTGNVSENRRKILLELQKRDYVIGKVLVIQNQVICRRNTNGEMGCTYAFDVEDKHYQDKFHITEKYS